MNPSHPNEIDCKKKTSKHIQKISMDQSIDSERNNVETSLLTLGGCACGWVEVGVPDLSWPRLLPLTGAVARWSVPRLNDLQPVGSTLLFIGME
ncbi:hypothetical protein CEXT_471411 [Caerostris extrusa]|uniref:Uncharacterized protein n=1 Tax=Caerostris extrusa TaxID=172846 RepID=A0AAV4U298_CAEEX|nr:hypothetical protein CEXT_471411 [Caerostris extrusa]